MHVVKRKNKSLVFSLAALITLLFFAVIFLMNYVQNLLYTDVKTNLSEVVTQNKDVITSKLRLEVNNLDLSAQQLADRLKLNASGNLQKVIQDYVQQYGDPQIFVATPDGTAYFSDGSTTDIAGRQYFRLAIKGNQNISEQILSRKTGQSIFVISVPLYYDGNIIGTVQKNYTPEEMYQLCTLSLYSSQGSMYIINSDGYILISSEDTALSAAQDNFLRTIYSQGNQDASRKLEEDIQNNRSGYMEITVKGERVFFGYTPIEDIHDWHLISSIATSAVSPNTATVIRMFYFILCMVTLVFGFCLFYFFFNKRRQQLALEKIAFVDSITGGNTFNKFLVELPAAMAANPKQSYSILAFDIDKFRYVNNYYGFDFGDRILCRIDEELSGKLLPGESLARVSGDQFVAFLRDVSPQRLNELLSLTFTEGEVTVYLSAGLYHITDPKESIHLMVDKASTAAQSGKDTLRKQIVTYTEQFDQTMIHNEQLKRQIEQALANLEIIPYFQPKVDVNTGLLVGAEALARWITPEGKLVPPCDFIPQCEKTGQITELDLCIFEQVLTFLEKNLKNGVKCVPISVNFSRLHLFSDDFIHVLVDRIDAHQIPHEYIEIELTESVFFQNPGTIISFADHLHEHGLLIAMDDFGSGYSSLNMLKDIPIDVLKIDKGFLDDTKNVDRQRVILSAVSQMALSLHTSIVVEGVETLENVNMMKEFGCTVAQGYYFAKPMNQATFQELYEKGQLQ